MKVAIIGGGAIGTVFAAVLHGAGHDVVLCARRSPAGGPRVDPLGPVRLPVLTDPAEARPADWVMVATKAYDVPGAAGWLGALVGPHTRVAVLRNGIDHAARLRPWLPSGTRVVPALIHLAVQTLSPGHVDWSFGDTVRVPADATDFAALFAGTPLRIVPSADFEQAAWRKLLLNLMVPSDPVIRALAPALLAEAVTTARAAGIPLPDEAITETIAYADGASTHHGRPTEHELIVGAVVRTAAQHGVDVPAARTVLALMRGMNSPLSLR
ncbi:ketopantoate reductase family protein [Paractinoplanes atraurantiacus]|uniref:ketopantoate reductase family protein n=1 Tax=Paractinoplanes atraurantiacus TaxID=1036182 RepID=UPI0015CF6C7B|nr:2-dehydropantoate 2-reductase N-terminal domain-containing protein [Actinoplanes atraurantiacus]